MKIWEVVFVCAYQNYDNTFPLNRPLGLYLCFFFHGRFKIRLGDKKKKNKQFWPTGKTKKVKETTKYTKRVFKDGYIIIGCSFAIFCPEMQFQKVWKKIVKNSESWDNFRKYTSKFTISTMFYCHFLFANERKWIETQRVFFQN